MYAQKNSKITLFIIIACVMVTIVVVYLVMNVKNDKTERFLMPRHFSCEVVLARYTEDVSTVLLDDMFKGMTITIYDKSNHDISHVIKLPNVGRESHTYLYHILQNYHSLADVTVFLPGSCMDDHKVEQTKALMRRVMDTADTAFQGSLMDDGQDVRTALYDFELASYENRNPLNREANTEVNLLPSPIRPFGAWYDAMFPECEDVYIIPWGGIFAVAKRHILQHGKERYERLISMVDTHSNPEVGHYLERSWGAVFKPYPASCECDLEKCRSVSNAPSLIK